MTTMFVAATLTAAMVITSAVGTSMIIPAFAQGDNMTGGGNATEGNMTGTDMAGERTGNTSSNDALDLRFLHFLTHF